MECITMNCNDALNANAFTVYFFFYFKVYNTKPPLNSFHYFPDRTEVCEDPLISQFMLITYFQIDPLFV